MNAPVTGECEPVPLPSRAGNGQGARSAVRTGLPALTVPLLAISLGACTAADTGSAVGYIEGTSAIETRNYANESLQYYYYIPHGVMESGSESHPVLVAVPGLSGRGEDFVSSDLKQFADEEGFVILAPSFVFDEANWDYRWSYQYPSVWSGEALLNIIEQFSEQQGVKTSGLYLFGYSAGAQFSLRFCLWRPDECVACAAHAWGGTVTPESRVGVRFLVTVGFRDEAWRIDKARAFRDSAEGVGIDVTYQEYDAGHTLTAAQVSDSLSFFAGADKMGP